MGDGGNVAILAAGYEAKPTTEKAKFILVDSNGMYTLQSFESGAMGKELHFVLPKSKGGAVERAAVKTTIEVAMK